jgi:uncharacterized protein (TIGR02001 family)
MRFTAVLAGMMACLSTYGYAEETSLANAELTANAAIVSKYVYRGGVENDDVALQAGLDYTHASGWSVGYWGSTLDYNPSKEDKSSGFEHDFYVGYARDLNEDWSYSSQVVAYVYQDSSKVRADDGSTRRTTAFELLNDVSYKDLTLGAAVMLADASFANAGDVYLSAAYSYALPQDFNLNASVGASVFNDGRDDAVLETTEDFVFSEARLGVSKEIANTGLQASLDYIWGGKDRMGDDFDDHTVISLTYNF